jgi:phosphohistidine phosphatase
MKTLLFIRHAKSSWESPNQKDFDRPLNDRGHKDAPAMAKRMLAKQQMLDALLSSTATRAVTTANYFLNVYKELGTVLKTTPNLYHALPYNFYQEIALLNNNWNHVAIFAHNPGITEMVNSFGVATIDDMPTCGVFGVLANITDWKNFETCKKQFLFFDYPKNI